MNDYNINQAYKQAVDGFSWDEPVVEATLPIPVDDFNSLINEISKKIISASQIRPTLKAISKKDLSLAETCYLVVQSQDQRVSNPTTVAFITEASQNEKNILKQAFIRLQKDFIQVEAVDLKAITLLFGIHRVHDLAIRSLNPTIITIPQQSTQIKQLEAMLADFQQARKKYINSSVSEIENDFLATVDAKIEVTTQRLEELQLQQALIDSLAI